MKAAAGPSQGINIPGIDMEENGELTGFFSIPPDPVVATGRGHAVTMVNTSIAWTTKAGTHRHTDSLARFFTTLDPVAAALFDPKIVYDQYSDRYVALVLEKQEGASPAPPASPANTSRILLAVSTSGDPNGGWHFQAIDAKGQVDGVDVWADFPGLSIDSRAIYVTHNVFSFPDSIYRGSRLRIIDKAALYAGTVATAAVYDPPAETDSLAVTIQPAHVFGSGVGRTGTFLVGYGGLGAGTSEALTVTRVEDPLGAPTFHQRYVNLGDIDDPAEAMPPAPQRGTGVRIATNNRNVLNAVLRNGHLYAGAQVLPVAGMDEGQATAHWFDLAVDVAGEVTLARQGNAGAEDLGNGTSTYYPAVAVNARGDMAVAFSASSPELFAGAYVAGRAASDPAGTLRATEVVHAGEDYYVRQLGGTANRWGDYTGLAVDPNDDATFWAYGEWAQPRGAELAEFPGEDGLWGTALGSFLFSGGTVTMTSLVGDKDDFVPGGPDDVTPKSDVVLAHYARIAANPESGQNAPVDLDVGGGDRPVGLTHYFQLPLNALITTAHLRVHVRGTNELYYNDLISLGVEQFPLVTFNDLLGFEPELGSDYVLDIDLGRVPVRTGGDQGPGGHWPDAPDSFLAFRDLRSELFNSFDAIFSDDHIVDYSELAITYATQPNTGSGTNVSVTPLDGLTVAFSEVGAPGHTTVTTGITPSRPLPQDYALGGAGVAPRPISVFDVGTTASFAGAVTLARSYDPAMFQAEGAVRFLHLEDGRYVDRTVAVDAERGVVTAQVSSLSEFVLAEFTGSFMSRLDAPLALINFSRRESRDSFQVTQHFLLGEDTNGIDPAAEPVEIGLGFHSESLPPGSFRRLSFGMGHRAGGSVRIWGYEDPRARGVYSMFIVILGARNGFVSYAGRGVDLDDTKESSEPSALPFTLRVGDDYGRGVGKLVARGDNWMSSLHGHR